MAGVNQNLLLGPEVEVRYLQPRKTNLFSYRRLEAKGEECTGVGVNALSWLPDLRGMSAWYRGR